MASPAIRKQHMALYGRSFDQYALTLRRRTYLPCGMSAPLVHYWRTTAVDKPCSCSRSLQGPVNHAPPKSTRRSPDARRTLLRKAQTGKDGLRFASIGLLCPVPCLCPS